MLVKSDFLFFETVCLNNNYASVSILCHQFVTRQKYGHFEHSWQIVDFQTLILSL